MKKYVVPHQLHFKNKRDALTVLYEYVFGLARRGSTIGFHLLWHTVELAMSTRLCLL